MSSIHPVLRVFSFVFFASMFFKSTAFACDATIDQLTHKSRSGESYNVFTDDPFGLDVNFNVKLKSDCDVSLVISALDDLYSVEMPDKKKLDFVLYAKKAKAQKSELVFSAGAGESEFDFSVRFPSGQFASAGLASKHMVARIMDKQGSVVLDEILFYLDVVVKPSSAVFLSGMARNKSSIDLGELTTAKVITGLPQLRIVSTSSYELLVRSDNNGKLRHAIDPDTAIDYRLTIANQILNLGGGGASWFGKNISNHLGEYVPMSLVIGDTEDKLAGTYRDTLHISIRPSLILK